MMMIIIIIVIIIIIIIIIIDQVTSVIPEANPGSRVGHWDVTGSLTASESRGRGSWPAQPVASAAGLWPRRHCWQLARAVLPATCCHKQCLTFKLIF
jgi:hypothetical protein